MTSKQLRSLFFHTGLPAAYCLAMEQARRERALERGKDHAAHHPGDRPAGDQLQGRG